MSRRTRQRRTRPRRSQGSGVSPPSRSGSGDRWAEVGKRIDVSYDVLGHPQQAKKPVEEGEHYEVLAYTDWGDALVPTVVKWSHGAVDSFTDPAKSREYQRKALGHAKAAELPVGGATIKVGSKEYIVRGGDVDYKAAQEKAKELRKQGHRAVIRKERVAGKPAYVIYARREAK